MAIASQHLPFLDACRELGGLQSPLWVLGSQQLEGSQVRVSDLMRERYGVTEYVDFDLNEDAAVQLDLTRPLPPEYAGGAGTVLDAGTIEHILDLRNVFAAVHTMIRPNGGFIALSPINWWDHAFVNFNPRLFRAFADANGYELVYEAFIFHVRLPVIADRHVHVVTRSVDVRPKAKRWVDRLMHRFQPARTLYGCYLRKVEDKPFEVPTDIFGNASPTRAATPARR
jgi:hypothetical protein